MDRFKHYTVQRYSEHTISYDVGKYITLARSWRSGAASVRGDDGVADTWEVRGDEPEEIWDDKPPQSSEEPEPPSVMDGDEASTDDDDDDDNDRIQSYRIGGRWVTHCKVDWSDWIGFSDDEGVEQPPVPAHESPEAAHQDLDGEPCF